MHRGSERDIGCFVLKGEVVVGAVLMACGSTEGGDSGDNYFNI